MDWRNLVLSSGGGMGSWQAGALAALTDERPCEYVAVAGTSVGALNGAVVCQYPVGKCGDGVAALRRHWVDAADEALPGRLRVMMSVLCCGACVSSALPDSYLDSLVDRVDWAAVAASDRLLYIGISDAESCTCEYHTNGPSCAGCGRRHTSEELRAYVKASMSIPGMFPATEVRGREYVDGGLCQVVPRVKFSNGLPVDIVVTEPAEQERRPRWGRLMLPMRLYTALAIMYVLVAEADVRWAAANHPNRRIIRPKRIPADTSILSFTRSLARKMFAQGYDETKSFRI